MVKGQPEVLAIIPARGGSKGIPRKNIRNFAGHPLIAYSIEAGLAAKTVTRVIVSTDDEEIAAVGRASMVRKCLSCARQNLPRIRRWTCRSSSTRWPGWRSMKIITRMWLYSCAQPRRCARRPWWMRRFACCSTIPRPIRCAGWCRPGKTRIKCGGSILQTGQMRPLLAVEGIAEPYNAPRQVLPPVYWQTGHIDAIRPYVFAQGSMSGEVILPVMIDPAYTVDIDTPKDWARYEWLVWHSDLDMVYPGRHGVPRRPCPSRWSWSCLISTG